MKKKAMIAFAAVFVLFAGMSLTSEKASAKEHTQAWQESGNDMQNKYRSNDSEKKPKVKIRKCIYTSSGQLTMKFTEKVKLAEDVAVTISDKDGNEYDAAIVDIRKKRCTVQTLSNLTYNTKYKVTISGVRSVYDNEDDYVDLCKKFIYKKKKSNSSNEKNEDSSAFIGKG